MTSLPRFVFDSFALLALFQNEPAADRVTELLQDAERGQVSLTMTVVNLGEVVYRTVRQHGVERGRAVLARIGELPIDIIDANRDLALAAATIKATYRIGYADCFVVALAQQLNATVITGDPDFQEVAHLVAIEWLPQR